MSSANLSPHPLADMLTWYGVVLGEIAPHLTRMPGLGRTCALRVDDPASVAGVRMIARALAEESGAEVARYCLQTGFGTRRHAAS